MLLGKDSDLARLFGGLVHTLAREYGRSESPLGKLGDLGTLERRLEAEVAASDAVAGSPAFVGAWSRKPAS
jgi:hypothetical protein